MADSRREVFMKVFLSLFGLDHDGLEEMSLTLNKEDQVNEQQPPFKPLESTFMTQYLLIRGWEGKFESMRDKQGYTMR